MRSPCRRNIGKPCLHSTSPIRRYETSTVALRLSLLSISHSKPRLISVGGSITSSPGVAEKRFDADPKRTLRLFLYSFSGSIPKEHKWRCMFAVNEKARDALTNLHSIRRSKHPLMADLWRKNCLNHLVSPITPSGPHSS